MGRSSAGFPTHGDDHRSFGSVSASSSSDDSLPSSPITSESLKPMSVSDVHGNGNGHCISINNPLRSHTPAQAQRWSGPLQQSALRGLAQSMPLLRGSNTSQQAGNQAHDLPQQQQQQQQQQQRAARRRDIRTNVQLSIRRRLWEARFISDRAREAESRVAELEIELSKTCREKDEGADRLHSTVSSLKNDVGTLSSELASMTTEVESVRSQRQRDVDSLCKQVDDMRSQHRTELANIHQIAQASLEQMTADLAKARRDLGERKARLLTLETAMLAPQEARPQDLGRIAELERMLDEARLGEDRATAGESNALSTVESLGERLAAQEEATSEALERLKRLKAHATLLKQEGQQALNEASDLKAAAELASNEDATNQRACREQSAAMVASAAAAAAAGARAREELLTRTEQLHACNVELRSLKARVAPLDDEVASLRSAGARFAAQAQAAEGKVANIAVATDRLNIDHELRLDAIRRDHARELKDAIAKKQAECELRISNMRQDNAKAVDAAQSIAEGRVQSAVTDCERAMALREDELEGTLEYVIAQAGRRIDKLAAELTALIDERDAVSSHNEALLGYLKTRERLILTLKQRVLEAQDAQASSFMTSSPSVASSIAGMSNMSVDRACSIDRGNSGELTADELVTIAMQVIPPSSVLVARQPRRPSQPREKRQSQLAQQQQQRFAIPAQDRHSRSTSNIADKPHTPSPAKMQQSSDLQAVDLSIIAEPPSSPSQRHQPLLTKQAFSARLSARAAGVTWLSSSTSLPRENNAKGLSNGAEGNGRTTTTLKPTSSTGPSIPTTTTHAAPPTPGDPTATQADFVPAQPVSSVPAQPDSSGVARGTAGNSCASSERPAPRRVTFSESAETSAGALSTGKPHPNRETKTRPVPRTRRRQRSTRSVPVNAPSDITRDDVSKHDNWYHGEDPRLVPVAHGADGEHIPRHATPPMTPKGPATGAGCSLVRSIP